ncbi:dihydrofolate synthase/folylpolyglutamate synthase [Roseiarcus fermentans]|uniref:Dihydrofolate synthase/folylpolyglutamate synthase n=1 Tax=Roseiarcus fermentans TaxID=1473586 RepID=A0A366EQ08_9HYPH|nr:Mur ligase family protein [Roseiarcus fermentans]RBP04046.1 dihydrofolate synthase/folylpolyglutamate synthase [Roseiarcus fermentans]
MAENPKLAAAMARLDTLTDWERRPRNRMRVGLEPARDLAARLGEPHERFRAVHVAGSKGKGSVSALIEAGLAHAGLTVGRYGSPHVEHVTERVSLGGHDVDPETLAVALTKVLDAYEAARREGTAAAEATWFDLLTLAAFVIFREAAIEWAVVEVGLGGRLDSTNIVDGEIAVVTNIGLEHTEILGDTRAKIAGEKAGIVKPGAVVATTLRPDDEAGRVIAARADALGCALVVSEAGEGATLAETNAALAGAVLDALGRRGVTGRAGEAVGARLLDGDTRARARLVGRMERFSLAGTPRPLKVVLDGAHVPFNIAAVLRDLGREPDLAGPCVAVVALARDKDAPGFLAELGRRATVLVCADAPSAARGRPAAELRAIAASLGIDSEAEPDARRAFLRGAELARRSGGWLLVTGSLYLVGALRGELRSGRLGTAASPPAP